MHQGTGGFVNFLIKKTNETIYNRKPSHELASIFCEMVENDAVDSQGVLILTLMDLKPMGFKAH